MTHRNASADNLNSPQGTAGTARPSAADWIGRLRRALDPPYTDAAEGPVAGPLSQRAAVLAPLTLKDGQLHVILTVRPDTMPRHAGQISFPGGRLHAGEAPGDAALRETHEEIGIAPAQIELLGRWETFDTIGGFRVTPFAGLVAPDAALRPDPREVAEVFAAPLDFLMDAANHRRESRAYNGGMRAFTSMTFGPYYIWGATAGMLQALSLRLAAGGRT